MSSAAVDWRVYVILDPKMLPGGASLYDVCRQALIGGAGVVQLRDKAASTAQLVHTARELNTIVREFGATFIVNDRVDVALASGAHGVHLGPEDMPVALAREIAPKLLIGGSAGAVARARELVSQGVDYLGSGAVFDAFPSKPNAVHERGVAALQAVVEAVDVPVVGIGGIDARNAAMVAATGAAGIAVIRAVCGNADPQNATATLSAAFESGSPTV